MRKIWNSEKLYDVKFSFDEKCRNIFNITKEYFKTKKKNPIMFVGGGLLLLILILAISFSYANLTPVTSVEIFSQNASFENGDMGSWKITKSAEWIEENIANINFKIESNLGIGNIYTPSDYIFVIEDSTKMGSIGQENLEFLYEFLAMMISGVAEFNEQNRFSLITFNSNYNIISDFTNDVESILGMEEAPFVLTGNTNYYQALNGVNELLSNYTKEEGKDCKVIFITAGSPNEETPKEVDYSKMLRQKYSFLKINSITAFYKYNENKTPLYNISDSVSMLYVGQSEQEMINTMLQSLDVGNYLDFKIEDTINSEYFDIVEAKSDIGEVTIDSSLENEKVIWELQDKYYSNTVEELDIKVKLKDEYKSSDGVTMFQTNIQEKITSLIYDLDENQISEEVISSLTPVLSTNYAVIYDNNEPETCTVSGTPETKRYTPFTTVEISEEVPTCSGYMFKGWKIVEDNVEQMGRDYFIMPSHDVTLKAEWAKVSIKKSMNSRVVEEGTLYAMMASNSVPDNIQSEFVTSPTGIDFTQISSDTNGKGIYQMASTANDDRPIYYYRGAVDNNNVKFANFCWKIVRTTDTGGVKLIYNGPPDEAGGCTNTTGEITTIGQGFFFDIDSDDFNSLAAIGYMYGNNKYTSADNFYWYDVFGLETNSNTINMANTKYYYSDDVSYDEETGLYTLINPVQYIWNDNYQNLVGKYTCNIGYDTECFNVVVVGRAFENNFWGIRFGNGDKLSALYNDMDSYKLKFGKNVKYNNGRYTLLEPYEISVNQLESMTEEDKITYPYSCRSSSDTCSEVYYNVLMGGTFYCFLFKNGEEHVSFIDYSTSGSPNTNDSGIKKAIDNWYSSNLVGYSTYLEDTIWCNNREFLGTREIIELLKDGDKSMLFNVDRIFSGKPSLNCLLGDSFSVAPLYKGDIQIGNGKLTYPIATLTADEIILAGNANSENVLGYLYNGISWYSLTPVTLILFPIHFTVNQDGAISYTNLNSGIYFRPSVSLKAGTKSLLGDGTPTNPFVIE